MLCCERWSLLAVSVNLNEPYYLVDLGGRLRRSKGLYGRQLESCILVRPEKRRDTVTLIGPGKEPVATAGEFKHYGQSKLIGQSRSFHPYVPECRGEPAPPIS
jgi:hypothetical protein